MPVNAPARKLQEQADAGPADAEHLSTAHSPGSSTHQLESGSILGDQEHAITSSEAMEAIPSVNAKGDIRQSETDLEVLEKKARKVQVSLMLVGRQAVEGNKAEFTIVNMKTIERAQEKMTRKGEDASVVTDMVRATIVADEFDDLIEAYKTFDSNPHVKTVKVKNQFGNPKKNNYRDMNVLVEMEDGVKAELQFHIKNIMDIKNGPEHKWYEAKQKMTKARLLEPDVEKKDAKFAREYQDAYEMAGGSKRE